MDKAIEQEFNRLVDMAWEEYDKAIVLGDEIMADFWKGEALDLIANMPENCVRIVS